MISNEEKLWFPDEEAKETMRLMMNIGMTYSDYYIIKYNKDLGEMLEWLSLAMMRSENKGMLFDRDKVKYLKLKDKMKSRLKEVSDPRFKAGDLVQIYKESPVATVVGTPMFDDRKKKFVIEVLMEGQVSQLEYKYLKPLTRKKSKSLSADPARQ